MTPKDFKMAVDGAYLTSFNHRSEYGIDKMNGFKMTTTFGLHLEITSVDHFQLETNDCHGFEMYSHPDVEPQ